MLTSGSQPPELREYKFTLSNPPVHGLLWWKPEHVNPDELLCSASHFVFDVTFLHLLSYVSLNWVFPGSSDSKESACNVGDPGLIPGLGRSLEKEMATHSTILAWRIPWTEESIKLQRTRRDQAPTIHECYRVTNKNWSCPWKNKCA